MRQNQHHYQTVTRLGRSLMPFQSPLCSPPPTHLLTKYVSCIMCVNIRQCTLHFNYETLNNSFSKPTRPSLLLCRSRPLSAFCIFAGICCFQLPLAGARPLFTHVGTNIGLQIQTGKRCKYNTATDANRREAATDDAFERFSTICSVSNIYNGLWTVQSHNKP